MKKQINIIAFSIFALSVGLFIVGCASAPKLGKVTPMQQTLNDLPAVTVAGKKLKFQFGGDVWFSKVDGKDFSAGSFKSEDAATSSTLTLKQTHMYSTEKKPGIGGELGWVPAAGPDIVLLYKAGPPASLTVK